jgi:hypothetical protein
VTARAHQRIGIAVVLAAGLPSTLHAAPPSEARRDNPPPIITDPADLHEVWTVYRGLGGNTQLRSYAKRAFALIRKYRVIAPELDFAVVNELLELQRYAPSLGQRESAAHQLQSLIALLRQQLLRMAPVVCAFDAPSDSGRGVIVFWRPQRDIRGYVLERKSLSETLERKRDRWVQLAELSALAIDFRNEKDVYAGRAYQYRLFATAEDGSRILIGETPPVTAWPSLFNPELGYFLLFVLVICGAVVFYISLASRGVKLSIRKIAGLEAVDEAVGRATEMGRPVLFVPGIQDMDNIQTVAGLIVLGRVARTAAEHDALLEVPTARSLVMTAARETVQAGYTTAGRPDAYDEKRIYYITNEQFGYVVAVAGSMVREKPAACIYMGAFFAESLIFAETANAVGSIQIAGTAEPAQLPFFVAACDYTLIGEEFFAASAYLSGEPKQLGSLKGQDVGKIVVIGLVLLGSLLATVASVFELEFTPVGDALEFIQQHLLSVNVGGGD